MTKREYLRTLAADVIEALRIANLPQSIEINGDYIYPRVAIERAQSMLRALKTGEMNDNPIGE